MFGLGDFWVSLVWVLVILSTLFCVAYGVLNWNSDGEDASLLADEQRWEAEEKQIEETL